MTMEDQNKEFYLLEEGKRLSECLIWDMGRDYFERQGISAWLHDVPFYVTSNPYIGMLYAKIVFHFILDWIKKHPEARKHPFYILELGAGPGRFSFYVSKAIKELRHAHDMDDVSIVLVMSDIARANLEYYQTHHALIPLAEEGMIDFALYDFENPTPLKLLHSGIELNQETLVNPLILFANYLIDIVSSDAFSVRHGKLYELLVSIATKTSNIVNRKPIKLNELKLTYHPYEVIKSSYYDDPAFDAVLELYREKLIDTSFLIPTGSIKGLKHLRDLANGKVLMISSDKAYSELSALENLAEPALAFHGECFSIMANCHAVGQYIVNCGGGFYPQTIRHGLKTCVYTMGFKLEDLPSAHAVVKDCIEKMSPSDFFNLYRHITETLDVAASDSLASFLQFSEWDPQTYMKLSNTVLNRIEENKIDRDTVLFLSSHMHKLAENYYHMPKSECVLFEIGVFYHALKRYQDALQYYFMAEKFIGDQFGLHYNVGLCMHHSGQNQGASKYFKRALELNPDSKEAKDWIQFLQKLAPEMKLHPKDIHREM